MATESDDNVASECNKLESFKLGEIIDETDSAVTYLGWYRPDAKPYIIKIALVDSTNVAEVLQEVSILHKLDSDCIIKLVDNWKTDFENTLCIQYEYYEQTLAHLLTLKSGVFPAGMDNIIHPLDYCISTALLGDLLGAVNYLATNNIVHTRLAPEHIYLCARGPVNWLKIGHFESAVELVNGQDVPGKCQQQFGVFDDLDEKVSLCLGKYIAPEVVRNIGYNTGADMYSVGAIAEYMFGLNITEKARSRITFIDHSIPRNYCRKLYDIVEKMLDKDRSLRPTARRVLDTQSEYVVYDYLDVNSVTIKTLVRTNPDFFDNPFVQKYLAHKLALNMVAEVVVA